MINRITYIVPLELSGNTYQGVLNKVRNQVSYWRNKGCNVQVIYISYSKPAFDLFENEFCVTNNGRLTTFFRVYLWRTWSTKKILGLVRTFNPDLIYTRYVLYWPFSNSVFKRYKTIAEMNTDDISEKLSLGILMPVYKLLRNLFLKSKSGFCCVSNDIKSTLDNKKSIVIPNGYDFENMSFKDKNYRGYNVVFMSSPNQYWQGIDKIILLASKLPDYKFTIIGWDYSDINNEYILSSNIVFLGYKSGSQLDALLTNADYAIGPLALHRKNMTETSALKTSHYLSFNLPVIQCYNEVGLQVDSILVLDNDEDIISDINIQKILNFFLYWKLRNVDIEEVRNQVGIDVTEEKRISFFESIFYET